MTTWTDERNVEVTETTGCGTTGCEAHDGECRNNWGDFDGPTGDTFWRMT